MAVSREQPTNDVTASELSEREGTVGRLSTPESEPGPLNSAGVCILLGCEDGSLLALRFCPLKGVAESWRRKMCDCEPILSVDAADGIVVAGTARDTFYLLKGATVCFCICRAFVFLVMLLFLSCFFFSHDALIALDARHS